MNGEFVRWVKLRWSGIFHRGSHEAALDREMQFHRDMLIEQNLAEGMTPADARLAALRELGGVDQYREACRDTWQPAYLAGLGGDFRFALRTLHRSPGFAVVAALTLALGIGVNAIIFSFIRDLVLRPQLSDRTLNLVALYNSRADSDRDFRRFSHAEFAALRDSVEVFADVAAEGHDYAAVGQNDYLRRRLISLVSENYFSLLGAQPFRGRFFTAAESQPDAAIPVLVATFAYWEGLGRPADFVGSTVRVNQRDYTVIGIAPPSFLGVSVSIGPDVWLPLGEARTAAGWDLRRTDRKHFNIVGRLQPYLSLDAARSRMDSINHQLNLAAPGEQESPRRLVIGRPSHNSIGSISPPPDGYLGLFASLAMGLSITVLIVACLNLANMLLARGAARQKEIAIRLSLGASRWRIVRQFLAEGLLLALLGGGLALFLGQGLNNLLLAIYVDATATGPFALSVTPFVDLSLVVATIAFALIATFASSLGPALRVTKIDLIDDLKRQSGSSAALAAAGGWDRFFSLGNTLVILQIALSLALLFSAALFVRGSWNAQSLDLGFHPDQQLVANFDYQFAKLPEPEVLRRQHAVLAEMAALPGVINAALASNVPYRFELDHHATFSAEGSKTIVEDKKRAEHRAGHTAVTHGYFTTMGITLLRGRDFTPAESIGTSGSRVVIIDESLARVLFGESDPIGRRLFTRDPSTHRDHVDQPLEVIGIVRSPRDEVFTETAPRRLYRPLGQVNLTNTYLHLRATEPVALIDAVRRKLRTIEPAAPAFFVLPMSEIVGKNLSVLLVRIAAIVFGVFGGIALVLAVVGVYGVKAHAVVRRTREIGIRLALGAGPREVMTLILKQGLLQTAVGLSLGLALALLSGQALGGMLYRVNGYDGYALCASAALLAAAVFLACWLPARRATRVDPIISIRAE